MTTLIALALLTGQGKLISKDVTVGTGAAAKVGDVITVGYKGTLLNGKPFDSSDGKPPFVFVLGEGQVIKGWDKGLMGAKTGTVRKLTIPPDMAYGSRGAGADIPPNSTLNFTVTVYRIEPGVGGQKIEIKELAPGRGKAAKKGDSVEVHYRGTFVNGVPFDNSYDRKQPLPVTLGSGGVVAGFDQGITGMKVGGKRKVTIPFPLGYGPGGRPPKIPPMSTLVFELELVKIK